MPTRRQAISDFLSREAHPDLAARYHTGIECQVLTAMDDGVPFKGLYKDVAWKGYHEKDTDCTIKEDGTHDRAPGCYFWKDFRIPWAAGTDAKYDDSEQRWSLGKHALGIGSTGWNWEQRRSEWFGFDFDSVANHVNYGKALTDVEMARVLGAVSTLEWVEVRKSKSGRGHHLYVTLEEPHPTETHHEHAALARSILHLMSGLVGQTLASSVDCVGGNIWLWHRDCGEGAFELVKAGALMPAALLPQDWRRHLDVTRNRARRVASPAATGSESEFDDLQKRTKRVDLDDSHQRLLAWHAQKNAVLDWAWDPDYHMLRTHSSALAEAHQELGMQGLFYTSSEGRDWLTGNCFAFPLPGGVWEVRRHGKGADEHPAWSQDPSGWTRCLLNAPATLEQACRAHQGVPDSAGIQHFDRLDQALKAVRDLGVIIEGLQDYAARDAVMFLKKGKAVLRFKKEEGDKVPHGWIEGTGVIKGKWWERVFDHSEPLDIIEIPDEILRSTVVQGKHGGHYLWSRGHWVQQPLSHVERALMATHGLSATDVKVHLGVALMNHWQEVNEPFGDEYPGDRKWNRTGARLAKIPKEGPHPYWDKMFNHMGRGLDEAVRRDEWCRKYGVAKGADYLKLWAASLFQAPRLRLPYLFFFSTQNRTGKSLFHEALAMFFEEGRGYVQAKTIVQSKGDFSARLAGAILCVVEEVDLQKDGGAYQKIKDWVTNPRINVHPKGRDDYDAPNYTHWIQTANFANHCPIEAEDTRIVMIQVPEIEGDEIPKEEFRTHLDEEASAFLHTLMELKIPPTPERLRIPAIQTSVKEDAQESSLDELEIFLRDECARVPGELILWSDFYDRFIASIDPLRRMYWPATRVQRMLPPGHPRGKYGKSGHTHIGNIAWADGSDPIKVRGGGTLQRDNGRLKVIK